MQEPEPDYYGVIGVAPDAAPDVIRRAYGERARETMNDRPRFEAVVAAFEVLKDTAKRAAYDRRRRQPAPSRGAEADTPPTGARMSTVTSDATAARPPDSGTTAAPADAPGNKTALYGGERTQAVALPPCPVCGTSGVPGEQFCVECGFLIGSLAG